MGKSCFVTGCRSGYTSNREKVSVFKVPKEAVDVWNTMIPRSDRELKSSDYICEKHFTPDSIIRVLDTEAYTIPLKKPRLAPNAIPTIFPSSNVVETQVEITYEHVTPKEELIESSFPDEPGDDIGYTNGVSADVPKKEETLTSQSDDSGGDSNSASVSASRFEVLSGETQSLFETLLTQSNSLQLPSSSWKVHKDEALIAIYKLAVTNSNVFIQKKIIITTWNIECFIAEHACSTEKISPNAVITFRELKDFLKVFDKVAVCSGGVSIHKADPNFHSKNYVQDVQFQCWRHCKCTLIVSDDASQCAWCKKSNSIMRVFRYRNKAKIDCQKT